MASGKITVTHRVTTDRSVPLYQLAVLAMLAGVRAEHHVGWVAGLYGLLEVACVVTAVVMVWRHRREGAA